MRRLAPFLAVAAMLATPGSGPAAAATPDAMTQGMTEAKALCRKASDLKNAATLGKPLLFSDANGKTAILVTGIWRPAHMKGARATLLCLYDRASRTAELVEAKNWAIAAPPRS